jgi:hypothetical protein
MAIYVKMINGLPRSYNDGSSSYYQLLTVVAGAPGANQIAVEDVEAGDAVTLPASKTYSGPELKITLNNNLLEVTKDYNYVGSGARTQISFLFNLEVDDVIGFRI